MRIIIGKDYDDMSRKAANIISAMVILKPDAVLGLATGTSPLGLYKQLIKWYEKKDIDFSAVRSVNLDEYVGLSKTHVQSYFHFMHEMFFNHINIALENCHLPNGMASDIDAECRRYDTLISSLGGIDLQLLGIGQNGHIGFNEPEENFEQMTHLAHLTQSTITANSRLFDDISDVPTTALSMGIKAIMQAKMIVLVASGKNKAQIIKQSFFGAVTPKVPASILQMHNNVILVVDEDAAGDLR